MRRIVFLGLLFSFSLPTLHATDWPVFRGNGSAQGVSDSRMPAEPKLKWEYSVPKGSFEATPVIAKGKVYACDLDGEVYCLELATGELVWKFETDSGFIASCAVNEDRVIAGDFDGKVYALAASSGEKLWEAHTNGQIDAGANFYKSLVLVTSEDGCLYAFQLADGSLAWKYETGDQLRCSATVVGNRTFLGGCDGKLHIVDLDLGESVLEKLPLDGPTGSTPTVQGSLVFIPTQSGDVLAYDWETGQRKWVFSDAERSPEIRSSPAVLADAIYLTTRNRRLLALNTKDGAMLWESVLRKRSDNSPAIADGRVWLGASDGRIMAMELATGTETWSYEVQGGFAGSPAIADQHLVIASDAGVVYCFGP